MAVYFRTKDKRFRHIVSKFEIKRSCLQFFLRSPEISVAEKNALNFKKSSNLTKALCFSMRSRNRCLVSGRAGSIFRYFRLSRIMLKQLASRGFLTGVRKSS